MPFLRFSRDKRGYENIYLVHTQSRRGKAPRQRILYWYRTPPGVKVGRPPFDEEARRRIEAQNPELTFDWPTIVATPIPPPAENEQWRERRRAERAAKQAQRAEDAAVLSEREAADEQPPAIDIESQPSTGDDTPERLPAADDIRETAVVVSEPQPDSEHDVTTEMARETSQATIAEVPGDPSSDQAARTRRRRGGRRRRGRRRLGRSAETSGPTPAGEGSNPGEPPVQEAESNEPFPDSESGEFDSNDE